MVVRIVNRSHHPLPEYETASAAGVDLRACLPEPIALPALGRATIPTGLYLEMPPGCEGQVRPRSGLAARHGVTVLNSPGTIDADYRGEIRIILVNLSAEPFTVQDGERIAQLVFARCETAEFWPVQQLNETARGAGGFGSTGK